MADDPHPVPGAEPQRALVERLESWKEIAAYLRRDVRTVQRWEQADGLPVHRHKRAHRPIPYAYKAELDAWWTSRSESAPAAIPDAQHETDPSRKRPLVAAAALLVIAATAGIAWSIRQRQSAGLPAAGSISRGSPANTTEPASPAAPLAQKSIAVLPFLDLSEGMKNEEFADGMTEELIDRLNKIPGLRVPAPTSTFFFKNKHVPIPEIARALGVAYVLDGSVRKAGARVRVAVRLIRADNADVVWSDTYDRAWSDILTTQDDIAGDVTTALRTTIDARPHSGTHAQ